MDRMIYIAAAGARQAVEQQASVAHNLANVSTTGFRAQLNNFRAVPVVGQESPTRVFTVASTPGADMQAGPMVETGRALDVAIRGDGWLAVQMPDGSEAYTRAGNLQVGADGQLLTMGNRPVLGDAGPLVVPPGALVAIAGNGVISAQGPGELPTGRAEIGRLRLVNPDALDLVRGDDGLFHLRPGAEQPQADPNVTLASGVLEGSNVNPVEAMVTMIGNARRYEMHMKAIQTADSDEQHANRLLGLG